MKKEKAAQRTSDAADKKEYRKPELVKEGKIAKLMGSVSKGA